MPDVWANVSALDGAMQDRLAGVLEAMMAASVTDRWLVATGFA